MKEFKEVAHYYLGTGLKFNIELSPTGLMTFVIIGISKLGDVISDDNGQQYPFSHCKPILRRMEDMYNDKEIISKIWDLDYVSSVVIEDLIFRVKNDRATFREIRKLLSSHYNIFGIKDYIQK